MSVTEDTAYNLVRSSYLEYGQFVNSMRCFPSSRDGLKTVQRRVLLATQDSGASNKFTKCATIVGNTIARFHPHGDVSIYSTIVGMVNQKVPLLIGKGNFGYRGEESIGAAAMRYTGAKLSDLANTAFLSLREHSKEYTNDLTYKEPEYLPTCLPYCLLNGSSSIGVGAASLIPPIKYNSLISQVTSYLGSGTMSNMQLAPLYTGWIKIDDKNTESINAVGTGSAMIGAQVKYETDPVENRKAIIVTDCPTYISYSKVRDLLRENLQLGEVIIRDEGTDSPRLVILRTLRTRRISDEEIFNRLSSGLRKTVTFSCYVSHDGRAELMGLKRLLSISIDNAVKAHGSKLESMLIDHKKEWTFSTVRLELAKLLLSNTPPSEIKSKLSLTDEMYSYCVRKSISSLSNTEVNSEDIESKITNVNSQLKELNKSYLESGYIR